MAPAGLVQLPGKSAGLGPLPLEGGLLGNWADSEGVAPLCNLATTRSDRPCESRRHRSCICRCICSGVASFILLAGGTVPFMRYKLIIILLMSTDNNTATDF